MKRETILFYLSTNSIKIYLKRSKKEYVLKEDTSLFFRYGEISCVKMGKKAVSKIIAKLKFGLYYLKPDVVVLYNDVCSCDNEFLYRGLLEEIDANEIEFVPLTKIAKEISDNDNLVVADGDYYTLVNRGEKVNSLDLLDFEPVIIGKKDDKHVHFSDDSIIWNKFKSYFTKGETYDIMEVGDD